MYFTLRVFFFFKEEQDNFNFLRYITCMFVYIYIRLLILLRVI